MANTKKAIKKIKKAPGNFLNSPLFQKAPQIFKGGIFWNKNNNWEEKTKLKGLKKRKPKKKSFSLPLSPLKGLIFSPFSFPPPKNPHPHSTILGGPGQGAHHIPKPGSQKLHLFPGPSPTKLKKRGENSPVPPPVFTFPGSVGETFPQKFGLMEGISACFFLFPPLSPGDIIALFPFFSPPPAFPFPGFPFSVFRPGAPSPGPGVSRLLGFLPFSPSFAPFLRSGARPPGI